MYSIVLSTGGEAEYNNLLKLIDAADLQEEKVRILRSLGSAKDEALIQRTLDYALSVSISYLVVFGSVLGLSLSVCLLCLSVWLSV